MQSRSHTDQETCLAQGAGRSQDVAPPTGDVPVPGCWEEPGRGPAHWGRPRPHSREPSPSEGGPMDGRSAGPGRGFGRMQLGL